MGRPHRDITNQKFGRWTAKEYAGNFKWRYVCDCGTERDVETGKLIEGESKSCGCLQKDQLAERNTKRRIDIIGKKFNKLRIIRETYRSNNGTVKYLCKCDCGKELEILGCSLTTGNTKSCGCLRTKRNKERRGSKNNHWKGGVTKKNIALYSTFHHKLTPVEETRIWPRFSDRLQVRCYKCREWFHPLRTQVDARVAVLYGKSTGESNFYCSDECKKSCSVYRRSSYLISSVPPSKRPLIDPIWTKMVLERDNYTCQICDRTHLEVKIHAHHIESAALNPILANDVDNGIAICKDCHYRKIHSQKGCRPMELRC